MLTLLAALVRSTNVKAIFFRLVSGIWFVFAKFQNNIADMSKMKLYRDFKTSMICLSRESGVEISRHASDIRKICQYQSFYKDKGKW